MKRRYDLPVLGSLGCFETAARHLSFKKAAAELNVTPAAVTHRIKALEADLGQALFLRNPRGVELTEAGANLFVSVQRSFETLSECLADIRARGSSRGVTIGATTAMSGFWLTPRLSTFWKTHGNIPVTQIVSDNMAVDTRYDLSIHYGDPALEKDETKHLFQDHIMALGTPRFAETHGIKDIEDLQAVPLIQVPADGKHWTDWPAWLAALGQPAPKGPQFNLNNYIISLQAAEEDVGAVLGWDGLLGKLTASGRLVQLVPQTLKSPWPFYLRIHAHASANARLFADWLVQSTDHTMR